MSYYRIILIDTCKNSIDKLTQHYGQGGRYQTTTLTWAWCTGTGIDYKSMKEAHIHVWHKLNWSLELQVCTVHFMAKEERECTKGGRATDWG